MCYVAELLLEAACIKVLNWRIQIVTIMEDGLRLYLWYDSVSPAIVGFIHFYSPISVESNHWW